MYTVYGIPNCDTIKKTLDWLRAHNIEFEFHDYKKKGITLTRLRDWCAPAGGWQKLLNKNGTTWKNLDADLQAAITTKDKALPLMVEYPSLIKRPVVEGHSGKVLVGFKEVTTYFSS